MAEPLDDPLMTGDAGTADATGTAVSARPDAPAPTALMDVAAPVSGGLSVYDGPAIDIAAELRTSYLGYAMSTIVSRALPDVRDGLKPVQRRILYAMRELGLSPNSRHLKSAKVVGECFVAGTRVATPSGLRKIEDLQIGDDVFTQTGVRPVTETYIMPAQPLLDVELGSGRNVFCTPGQQFKVIPGCWGCSTLRCKPSAIHSASGETAESPAHSADSGTLLAEGETPPTPPFIWKRADELAPGDVVITRGGTASGASTDAVTALLQGLDAGDTRLLTSDSRPFLNGVATLLFAHGVGSRITTLDKVGGKAQYALVLCADMPMDTDAVRAVRPATPAVTYDIQVAEEHEFVANGMLVHNCMGNFHPHGDQALYGTMVRMAQPFSLRYPMVDGQGNFGSVDDDPPAAMRYCITYNNLVVTGDGLVPAGAIAETEDIATTVLSLDGKTNTASKWFDCGAFPVRTVRTRRGYEVTGTTNHPLLVCVPGEGKRTTLVWKMVADLRVGDYMVLDRSETLFPDAPVNLTPYHPTLPEGASREERSFPAQLSEIFAHTLGQIVAAKESPFRGLPSNDAFLAALGLCANPTDRVIPPAVLQSPQSVLAAFLRGLFGLNYETKCTDVKAERVSLIAKNHALLQQAQTVLLRFGIVATLAGASASEDYRLTITGVGDVARFHDRIAGSGYFAYHGDRVEAITVGKTIKPAVTERYLFDPVVAITDAGTQNVYSIRVDSDCHSFVANGFVNHNTEARLTAVAMEMMEDIEKDTVNFQPTYDNERREPTVLPGKFPYLICNGGSGIAVGMATNAPPHNLKEVCDACAFLLEHPDASIEQLMTYVPGPDFPTAGLILGSKGIRAAYHTGRGQVTMQAKTTIEPMDGGKSVIVISELPYQVIKKKLEEQIGDLVKEKKIDGITAVRDYSDKSGMRLVVELRRDVMPQKILNYLLKHTPLRLNFGAMMISLTEGGSSPKTLDLKTILQEYLDHRREIITRRTKFELARAKARAHILEGLQIAVQFLDEVIAIIRGSNSTEQARLRLIERFSFSGLQAEAILNMQLRQLTSLEQDKIEGEFKDLLKEIARFEDILMDARRVNAMIKADLKYLKDKFGDDRKTRIIPAEAEEINLEDLIKEEEMLITVTRDGYIKRLDYDTFRSQKRGGKGVTAGRTREEDNFEHLFRASTHDYILFFTDRGRVYRLKAFEVPQTSRQAMGTAIINLISIQPDEKITATVPIRDLRTAEGFLLMVTTRGEIKRTAISEYANLRANGLLTFDLEGDDRLKWVKHTPGTAEVILTTVNGMAIRFPEEKVPTRGRAAGGVRGITLDGLEDFVVSADVVIGDADAQELLVISELGLGKRTSLAEYRSQNRGGKGLITMKLTDKTGKCLVVATVVSKDSEPHLRLMIVTENGVMIRMKAEEIKTTLNRSTQGVKLINLKDGDRVKTAEVIDVSKAEEEVEE